MRLPSCALWTQPAIPSLRKQYTGSDYEADMAALSAEPRDVAWHKLCDNMQIDYPWKDMECVFRNP